MVSIDCHKPAYLPSPANTPALFLQESLFTTQNVSLQDSYSVTSDVPKDPVPTEEEKLFRKHPKRCVPLYFSNKNYVRYITF